VVDEQEQAAGPVGRDRGEAPVTGAADGKAPAASAAEGDAVTGGTSARRTRVLLRRAPRYRAFVLTGVVAGLVGASVVALSGLFPLQPGYSAATVFIYFGLGFALFGGVLGAVAALLVERRR
jgi:hypothetical protein